MRRQRRVSRVQQVFSHWLEGFSFAGMSLDEALRSILMQFKLPGESQQIDRILEKFSARVFATNPDVGFKSEDTAYVLAFR